MKTLCLEKQAGPPTMLTGSGAGVPPCSGLEPGLTAWVMGLRTMAFFRLRPERHWVCPEQPPQTREGE